jgi:hypothetical protein
MPTVYRQTKKAIRKPFEKKEKAWVKKWISFDNVSEIG